MLRNIQRHLRRLGVDIRGWPSAQSLAFARTRILRSHSNLVVLDVGANVGQWGSAVRESGFRGTIISFEPLPEAFSALTRTMNGDPDWLALPFVVGAQHSAAERFNVASNDGQSSSLLSMTHRHHEIAPDVDIIRSIEVEVVPLDCAEVRQLVGGGSVYLKADVQGSEALVLDGLRGMWPQVMWVEVETWLQEAYDGAPTFWDIAERMISHGFALFALEPGGVSKGSGQQLSVDCIWKRDTSLGRRSCDD